MPDGLDSNSDLQAANATLKTIDQWLYQSSSHGDIATFANATMSGLWLIAQSRSDFVGFGVELANTEHQMRTDLLWRNLNELNRLIHPLIKKQLSRFEPKTAKERLMRDLPFESMESAAAKMDLSWWGVNLHCLLHYCLNVKPADQRLPLMVEFDRIRIGRHTRISFNRTLRVPDNGKCYPLPAGFGRLSIYQVADYAQKVPQEWLTDGGFFIPLYQREALYLEFEGAEWHPSIVKVAVGRVNALSGKPYSETIHAHEQDYVVVPDQQWLDGIISGDGLVGQFVAMPLGQGYTIEEQVTDEAQHGGFQLCVFESTDDRFPEMDPARLQEEIEQAEERRVLAGIDGATSELPSIHGSVMEQALRFSLFGETGDVSPLGLQPEEHIAIFAEALALLCSRLSTDELPCFKAPFVERYSALIKGRKAVPQVPLFTGEKMIPDSEYSRPLGAALKTGDAHYPTLVDEPIDMGIARGGSIKQDIVVDQYGVQSWDPAKKASIVIRIVNSVMFERITGLRPPSCPITAETYKASRIPWYSKYDENVRRLNPASILKAIRSIGTIDRKRGNTGFDTAHDVSPELIKRIFVPSSAQRTAMLATSLQQSLHHEYFDLAIRDATHLLEITPHDDLALRIRAESYLESGNYDAADLDASQVSKYSGEASAALAIRATVHLKQGAWRQALAYALRVKTTDSHWSRAEAVLTEILANHRSEVAKIIRP